MFANLTEPNSITASTKRCQKALPTVGRGRAFDRMTAGLRLYIVAPSVIASGSGSDKSGTGVNKTRVANKACSASILATASSGVMTPPDAIIAVFPSGDRKGPVRPQLKRSKSGIRRDRRPDRHSEDLDVVPGERGVGGCDSIHPNSTN